jgi:hypothetical protein
MTTIADQTCDYGLRALFTEHGLDGLAPKICYPAGKARSTEVHLK